ncbi:hypothetical protein [Candidatus Nitrotoga arctica]|uniref:Uncharacterized protein n=1 Tax=Candidatus Nitrotoga arctica TaxID=453162 RepID=A0ABN8AJY1_9PROT|nr:hypothetical protein [Candidatus Nitrotoga arctica]CAG9933058.1 conserved protein of unknown function [Candidatus Nitrotoga arctica]
MQILIDQTGLNSLMIQEQICQDHLTHPGWRSRDNLVKRGQINHGNHGNLVHQDQIGRPSLGDRGQKCQGSLVHLEVIDRSSPVQHQELRAHGTDMEPLDMQALINLVGQDNQIHLKEIVLGHLVGRVINETA